VISRQFESDLDPKGVGYVVFVLNSNFQWVVSFLLPFWDEF